MEAILVRVSAGLDLATLRHCVARYKEITPMPADGPQAVSWLVQNKELIAAVGTLLGVAPRALEILGQLNRRQKENRRLTLERQDLELSKLRHEIEKIRRELGEPPTPVTKTIAFTLAPADHPANRSEALTHEGVALRIPESVRWLLARPPIGRPVLWVGQVIFGLLLAFSVFVTFVLPVMMLTEPTTSSNFGVTVVGVELVYILMSWAFLVFYRKLRSWRRSAVGAS